VSDRQTQAQALLQLGMLAHKERDFTQATRYYEHSLSICREIGDGVGAVMELGSSAELSRGVDYPPLFSCTPRAEPGPPLAYQMRLTAEALENVAGTNAGQRQRGQPSG
jgi:hypothetical protein